MPRIRSLKPEFWSSPGIGSISPWARLLYQAMWNWADDEGRGTCNLRELQGFAFPDDPEDSIVGSSDGFRRVLAEVRGHFGVIFYKVGGRPYFEIPSFNRHQRTERRADGRYPPSIEGEPWDFMPTTSQVPEPPAPDTGNGRNIRDDVPEVPTSSVPVFRNRGTGEQGKETSSPSSERETAPPRADVDELCQRLVDWIVRNGSKPPTVTRRWRESARLLLDADQRPLDKALALIDWCQRDDFWRANIRSMPKFREKYDQLRLRANSEWQRGVQNGHTRRPNADDTIRDLLQPTGTDAVILQLPTGGQP